MKQSICILLLFISGLSTAQNTKLKIQSITEYIDGYVIRGVDIIKNDTLSIVSKKETIAKMDAYKKLRVGEQYVFHIDNKIGKMAAMPQKNFVVRIKTTIVWSSECRDKNIPVFATNLKGVHLEKDTQALRSNK